MTSELLITFAFFALGAVGASFIGVVAERLHTGQSWLSGRSRCNSCRRHLDGRDLIPILSWFVYAGKCRQCRARVPGTYALSEAVLGTAFAATYHVFGFALALPFFLAALVVLLLIVLYDIRHLIVPAGSSGALLVLSGIVAVLRAPAPQALGVVVLIAGSIGLFFFLLHVCSRGRAMGLADAPVALALSLLTGSQALAGLLFSFWIGALYGLIVLSTRRGGPRMGIEVPFVPFLAIGFLLAFFTAWNPFTLAL